MVNILVVGQTPPPFGGQAVMVKKLIEQRFNRVKIFHVRMAFSQDMDDVGKFQLRKLIYLFQVIALIIYIRFRHNIQVLYYPPAGPNKVPMFRDLVILISTRWLFKRVIFHFHAGGVSELYPKLSPFIQFFFRLAYFEVDVAIRLSELNPPDGQKLRAKTEYVVPYGIEDCYVAQRGDRQKDTPVSQILFVGVLCESKGILTLLEAGGILNKRGLNFGLKLMGKFESTRFRRIVLEKIALYGLEKHVEFLGVLAGDEKWKAFINADIFCFPSFFESETFGLVVLEAMQFSLPVIATRWRGIPCLVKDGESGYLVPIQDSKATAEKLEFLLKNPAEASRLGQRGRELYLEHYTIDKWYKSMEAVFSSVLE